jgi:hypothetical protein
MMAQKTFKALTKPYSTDALIGMGFARDGAQMVKRGARRVDLAIAYSANGDIWRITPLVGKRVWRP